MYWRNRRYNHVLKTSPCQRGSPRAPLLLKQSRRQKSRRQRDADQLLDAIDSIDVASDIAQTAIIVPFIQTEWQGRVFKSSNYFNNPTIEKRILIMCESNLEDFYFTALFDKKGRNWFLLSGNFTNKNPKRYYIRPMERQELLVLKDLDDICDECKEQDESVSQNLILTGFKICKSCRVAKTIFPI